MKFRSLTSILSIVIILSITLLAACNTAVPTHNPTGSTQTVTSIVTVTSQAPPSSTSKTTSTQTSLTTSTTQTTTTSQPPSSPVSPAANTKAFPGTLILGSPSADSIALNLLAFCSLDFYIEYGKTQGSYSWHTNVHTLSKDQPLTIDISGLDKDSLYYYRVCHRVSGQSDYLAGTEFTFRTQRAPGSIFSFGVQGDSHPERLNKMFDPDLYTQNMNNVIKAQPDFYFTMGDDFSIEKLIDDKELSQTSVNLVYAYQRAFLGIAGQSSPIFMINGNHEQAAKYLLDSTPNNAAVLAGIAKNNYYPLPAPGSFYSGDSEQVQYIGYLRDYYAWTWGDALFVVIDPYWHSSVAVDNVAGGGDKRSNMWDITLGDVQYNWFKQTLESSKAKYKFVFTHQVLGTGRGGIELAGLYEWGGKNSKGVNEFAKMRPSWEMPIHELMVKNGVNIFFHAHDHLFAQQELDGVIYQSVPIPADPTYTAFNSEAFKSGKILPNSGFLNVIVSPDNVRVDYIRAFLPKDQSLSQLNGQNSYSYVIK
jgi:hypothetical protein